MKIVNDNRDTFIDLAQRMIAVDSQTCREGDLAKLIVSEFQDAGIESFIDGVGNAVGIIRGEGTGPNIMFNGHLDRVPTGNLDNWAPYEPFDPIVEDGNLFGRGVSDVQAGLATQILAMKAINECVVKKGIKLPGDVIFTGVVQEEAAEMFGMEYFFDHTMEEKDIKVDVVYLCEATRNNIALGHRGKIELVVTTYGKICHSSTPKAGINALDLMRPILDHIFTEDGIKIYDDPQVGRGSITVTNCITRPGALSTVPDECEISLDRRYTTDQTLDDVIKELQDIIDDLSAKNPNFKATVTPRYFDETSWTGVTKRVKKFHPPWKTDWNNEFVQKTVEALRKIGQDPQETYWQFGTDGSSTAALHNIPTIGYSGADEKWAHQPQERVNIDDMMKTYEGNIAIVAELFGLDLNLFD